jgi:transcriptional regulator with GAF, ATPase, and Fis domain
MPISKKNFYIEAINLLCSSLDVVLAMDRFASYLKTMMPIDMLNMGIYEPELKCIRTLVATTDKGIEWIDELLPVHEKTAHYIENGDFLKPILINDLASDKNLGPMLDLAPPKYNIFLDRKISIIGMALVIDGEWIGNCALSASGLNKYTQEHADLLEPLQEPLALILTNCLRHLEIVRLQKMLTDENQFLQNELREVSGDVIGQHYGLRHVMEMVAQTAPKDNPVMLNGETGTGKEVIANAIHYSSPRRHGPFIKVNCGAIPENLIDSELFGHEKGAFTGAFDQKRGRFERANKGTIFLDEIGELPMAAQVRLLRVIQTHEIERVGGTETISLDIRIITATHRDLTQMAAENQFREDLLFRINVFPIIIPPLRQRKMDIPELVDYFIERKAKELKLTEQPRLAPGTMDPLISYSWPGNVRELENVVERALIRYSGGYLTLDDFLSPKVQPTESCVPGSSSDFLSFAEMSRQHILEALRKTNNRVSGPKGAAALLGMHHNTMRSKMKKLGL